MQVSVYKLAQELIVIELPGTETATMKELCATPRSGRVLGEAYASMTLHEVIEKESETGSPSVLGKVRINGVVVPPDELMQATIGNGDEITILPNVDLG